jgi:transposase
MERKAQSDLREVIRQLKEKEFKYESRPEKEVDWHAYNEAQLNDLRFFLKQTRELVDKAAGLLPKKPSGVGRPAKEAADVAKADLLMEYLKLSERAASTWAWVFKEKLGITDELSPRTIGRGFENPDVIFILERVFEWTSKTFEEAEKNVAIDATGVSESIKQNYESIKSDDKSKAEGFLKLSLAVGTECHGISAYALSRGSADTVFFEPLLVQTHHVWKNMENASADAGYLARRNCQAAADSGIVPYIFPKTGVTLNQKGYPAWKSMLLSLTADTQGWLFAYHLRSNSETVNSCLARRFGKLSCVKELCKNNEELTRLILHNLRQENTAWFEGKISLKSF